MTWLWDIAIEPHAAVGNLEHNATVSQLQAETS